MHFGESSIYKVDLSRIFSSKQLLSIGLSGLEPKLGLTHLLGLRIQIVTTYSTTVLSSVFGSTGINLIPIPN